MTSTRKAIELGIEAQVTAKVMAVAGATGVDESILMEDEGFRERFPSHDIDDLVCYVADNF